MRYGGMNDHLPAHRTNDETRPFEGNPLRSSGAPAQHDSGIATVTAPAVSQKLVLSIAEAAALLGISRDLAYDLAARGEIPSLRLGRRIVVPTRALLALVEAD
jgi:excisionase family DNA binding protein